MTNMEIIESNLGLIRRCVDCQFSYFKDKQFKEDLHNDLIVTLSEYSNSKLNDALENGHFNALITRIIQNNIWSKTSPFYKEYYRFQAKTDDISDLISKENDD